MFKASTGTVLIALGLLQGCSSQPQQTLGAQTYFRGLVRAADNQLQIRECNQYQWQTTGPLSEALRETLVEGIAAAPMGVGVYLEAWGEPDQPIKELQMLGGDLRTCQHQLSGVMLRAGGLDPVWYADIKSASLEVHDSTRMKSWRFTETQLSQSSDRWRWQQQGATLEVSRSRCMDKLGVEYAFSARFSSGSTRLEGCARYGDLERMLMKSRYYSRDKQRRRQIGLELRADEVFVLSLIDQGGARESYTGEWRLLAAGQLLLQLQDERLAGAGGSLRFVPEGAGFKLANAHPLFGNEVLLYPGTEPLIAAQRAARVIP